MVDRPSSSSDRILSNFSDGGALGSLTVCDLNFGSPISDRLALVDAIAKREEVSFGAPLKMVKTKVRCVLADFGLKVKFLAPL